jgi:hypothetical protein
MGCDIHAFLEYKNKNKWISKGRIFGGGWRDYEVFGILAGVRTPITPIIPLRGMPKDACKDAFESFKEYGCDGHSHTWYMANELIDWNRKLVYNKKPKFESWYGYSKDFISENKTQILESYESFIEELEGYLEYEPNVCRIVMFFDN